MINVIIIRLSMWWKPERKPIRKLDENKGKFCEYTSSQLRVVSIENEKEGKIQIYRLYCRV